MFTGPNKLSGRVPDHVYGLRLTHNLKRLFDFDFDLDFAFDFACFIANPGLGVVINPKLGWRRECPQIEVLSR